MSARAVALSLFLVAALACAAAAARAADTIDARAARVLARLTLEQKVGQLFMVGGEWRRPGAERQIARYHFGNAYLGRDDVSSSTPEQVARLTNRLQGLALKADAGVPLLIATDQEGGEVNRLKAGFVTFPSQRAMGVKGAERVRRAARVTAAELRAVGVQVNFAPVADLAQNPAGPLEFRGRLYSRSPSEVAELAEAAVEGYADGGVIACVKHFPSYGAAAQDAHDALPLDPAPKDVLMRTSVYPFAELIRREHLRMVMTGHIRVPALDRGPGASASLSKGVVDGFLRGELGFGGVAVTDGLNMKALGAESEQGRNAVAAVAAGNDILLSSGHASGNIAAYEALLAAFRDGRLPMSRLDQAVLRVLTLKLAAVPFARPQVDLSALPGKVDTAEQRAFLKSLAR